MQLRLEGVSKTHDGRPHLYPTDLDFEPGLNVLLGPTTAGKTTLLRLLAGLDRPTSGKLLIDGTDITGLSVRQRSVAMVYQQFINYPSFTVFDNIASPLQRAGVAKNEIRERVEATATMLRIERFLKRLPAELSGGQQQRTAIARALIVERDLLLLDEPLVNLDYKLREELRAELRAIFARRASTVVYATTEPQEALMLGGRIVVLNEGRAVQTGQTVQVYHHPASTAVAGVFSDPPMNMLEGDLDAAHVRLSARARLPRPAHLSALAAGRYSFGIRAGHISIFRRHECDVAIKGIVDLAEISGSETFVHAAHDGASLVVQEEGVHEHRLGQEIDVFVDPDHLYAFAVDTGALLAAPARNRRPQAA